MSSSGTGIKKLDFYRKIPQDLTEATVHGGYISLFAMTVMFFLFSVELWAFLSTSTQSTIVVDFNKDQQIRINFNITMLDLPCEFATVDVLDVLGTNQQNVTKNIEKWHLDRNAERRLFQGRNREQRDLLHDEHHPDLDTLLQNGEHAPHVDGEHFKSLVENNQYVFANFYAPWCVWCQRLAPTWEAFAEAVEEKKMDIKVVKIDCVANRDLCGGEQQIRAFPTLRLFKGGKALSPDYREDRTVDAFTNYIERTLDLHAKIESSDPVHRERIERTLFADNEFPGCLLNGFLLVNRVPGNFHIEARSKYHNLNPSLTNTSHIVHDLTFGPPSTRDYRQKLKRLPSEFLQTESPLAGHVYINDAMHEAFHHYLKVVSTHYEVGGGLSKKETVLQYQMVVQSQVMHYADEDVPEAKFNYDISPMSVVVSSKRRRWYEFVTSLFGILGGTFTVLGLLDNLIHKVFKPKKM